ncbi:MAG: tRNA uridine-5-carboxymethylaminomethyl(34) synthesis enzyme MnmG [Elusimicrobia bacterium GWA2_56_46]|nr:MAG: tRNA uridine-5-carboxymethylaminomethyl(34) synthesis enzyme MnmG [Elusimicrobia bacterium GWA2_56_46]OGR55279.1 MAG: tRNA uridine-5-carboxymethylaminomethyl(34) synthesis enzyme MnmG [Elusimicrobia bacterium GWC2_56_31]HBW23508.1 tRNA uridine-5-carboxymethylaminomethyl(34) synthesis enzyme MnmG [Elusimicrobiota bacterium]
MPYFNYPVIFDVLVVGGGHAGCEAALAAAGLGMKTLLLTQDLDTIAQMSCNPSIGGVGKGQIVREIDALGGRMAAVADLSALSAHMLNTSRGAAVRSPRVQCDKRMYQSAMKHSLELAGNLALAQDEAAQIWTEGSALRGVITARNTRYRSKTVILTTGTFLKGVIHIGLSSFRGGRYNHPPSDGLSPSLEALGFKLGRLKTGTPMRLNGRSIDFSKCEEQKPDEPPPPLSHFTGRHGRKLLSCWITRTGERSAGIIRANLHRSPLYSGRIKAAGPRYCPSIEDKIVKFPHHPTHILFLEPEGFDTGEYYVNGLSTSLPEEVQLELLHSVNGLERAELIRAAYAIEYDYSLPVQLDYNLEAKLLPGLFMAGQINGTTGYEEAAAQGLMAGINASLKVRGGDPFILGRDEAYIGVMIDDLISKGVDEPYRIFTSRAEFRLLLRQDNADLRLMPHGFRLGLIPGKFKKNFERYQNAVERSGSRREPQKHGAEKRPQRADDDMAPWTRAGAEACGRITKEYGGYITRNLREAERMKHFEHVRIPEKLDLSAVKGLCLESRQQFLKIRPRTLAQAARIPGVTPADIQLLWVHVTRKLRPPQADGVSRRDEG